MESRFSKYKTEGQMASTHIASINNFIDYLNKEGIALIEAEIQDLIKRMNEGATNNMFPRKKDSLITLGEDIEKLYELYHFNKGDA